jgi:hypothetical protein
MQARRPGKVLTRQLTRSHRRTMCTKEQHRKHNKRDEVKGLRFPLILLACGAEGPAH